MSVRKIFFCETNKNVGLESGINIDDFIYVSIENFENDQLMAVALDLESAKFFKKHLSKLIKELEGGKHE